jgi:aminomethyltransferase
MNPIKRTPYHHKFVAHGATFVDRLGFPAPMVFTSTAEEHRATREAVGIFDVYYQIAVEVAGRDAAAFVDHAVVADAAGLPVGRAVYTSLCNDAGGMIDDLTCFRLGPERYWFFPTASRAAAVPPHCRRRNSATRWSSRTLAIATRTLRSRAPLARAASPRSPTPTSRPQRCPTIRSRWPLSPTCRRRCSRAPATRVSWATRSSIRSSTPSTCGTACSKPVRRLVSARAASARCARCASRRSTCCSAWMPTTRPRRSRLVSAGRSSSTSRDSQGRTPWRGRRPRGRDGGWYRSIPTLEFVPAIGAAIAVAGIEVGKVTSADCGYTVGKALALGYVRPDAAQDGLAATVAGPGGARAGTIRLRAAYDPDGLRVRT